MTRPDDTIDWAEADELGPSAEDRIILWAMSTVAVGDYSSFDTEEIPTGYRVELRDFRQVDGAMECVGNGPTFRDAMDDFVAKWLKLPREAFRDVGP